MHALNTSGSRFCILQDATSVKVAVYVGGVEMIVLKF